MTTVYIVFLFLFGVWIMARLDNLKAKNRDLLAEQIKCQDRFIDLSKHHALLCKHLGVEYFAQHEYVQGYKQTGKPGPVEVADLPLYTGNKVK